jgi:hypothetical protein
MRWRGCTKDMDTTIADEHAANGPTTRTGGLALQTTIPTLATPTTQSHTLGASETGDFWTQRNRALTPHDYHDFLKRSRRKLYQRRNRMSLVGDYLSVLDTQMWKDPRDIVERATTFHSCVREAYHWVTKMEPDAITSHCKQAPPFTKQQEPHISNTQCYER